MQLVALRETLDRGDRGAVRLDREHQARVDADVVHQHGARAALPDETALLGPGQPEVVPEDLEERVVREDVGRARAPVHGHGRCAGSSS